MALTATEGQDYLLKHDIPQLMESMMIGLLHERPEDPLDYITSCVKKTRQIGGTSRVLWDSFVSNLLPPIIQPIQSPIFRTETPSSMMNQKSPLPPIGSLGPDDTENELSTFHYPFPDENYQPITPTAPPLTPVPPAPQWEACERLPSPPTETPEPLVRQSSSEASLPPTPDTPKMTPPEISLRRPDDKSTPPLQTQQNGQVDIEIMTDSSSPTNNVTQPLSPQCTSDYCNPENVQTDPTNSPKTDILPPEPNTTSPECPTNKTETFDPEENPNDKDIPDTHSPTEISPQDNIANRDMAMAAEKLKTKTIVFVVGGPGSGKGTQCDRIREKYGFTHFSSGDLLRAEVASGSEKGKELSAMMERGELVPLSTVLELIKTNMLEHADHSKGYLIDGYPRDIKQGIEFENAIAPCSFVLWIDASQETMVQRLLKRAETSGRADDNEETIRKRLKTFVESTEPVISYYEEKRKVRRIDSENDVDKVFGEVEAVFNSI